QLEHKEKQRRRDGDRQKYFCTGKPHAALNNQLFKALQRRGKEINTSLLAQNLQNFPRVGEFGSQCQASVDRLLLATLLEQHPIDTLKAQQYRPEDERTNEPKFGRDHRCHKARLGSKWFCGMSKPICFRSTRKLGRMPVARNVP